MLDGEKMSGDRWVLGLDVAGLREIRVFSQALLMLNIQAEAYLTHVYFIVIAVVLAVALNVTCTMIV